MAMRFGVPPEADNIRSMVHERLAEAKRDNGAKVSVDWRDDKMHLQVITMPVDLLYYNPDTHRIRAQRSMDPDKNRILETEPWSKVAQSYLDRLLKNKPSDPENVDPDFEALRENLRQFGQKEPGIITATGILVNGNTRCAALRDLKQKHIQVGVLPETAVWDDINSVELSLQLRKDHKREYSYINRLLAIEEQVASGRREADIARDFHIQPGTLRQDRWVHSAIQDLIERSRTDGVSMRLIDFEDHQEKLRELQRAYEKLLASDRDGAEALRESRMSMIVLGMAKTDLRLADASFYDKYLSPKLPDSMKPSVEASGSLGIPGLGVAVPDASKMVKVAKALTDQLLKAKATVMSGKAVEPAKLASATKLFVAAHESFDKALDQAGRDARLRKRKVAPTERLSDACDDIENCIAELAQAAATRALDPDSFDDAAIRLRSSLTKLAKQAARAFPEQGEGIGWLVGLVKDPQ